MMTVDGLRTVFERIDERVRGLIESGKGDSALGVCLRNAWNEYFHQVLSTPAVKGMISHYRAMHKSKKDTRKQKGGMAPLDYMGGQGTTDAVYGRFPVEIGTSPSVVQSLDRFYESPIGRSCNATGGFDAPPQMGGRRSKKQKKQVGGNLLDAVFIGHAPASVPRNFVESTVSTLQGRPILNPPASPVTYTPGSNAVDTKPFDPQAITQMSTLAPVYSGY